MDIIEQDHYYHIFNRGINSDMIFYEDENKTYFLELIAKHLKGKAEILSYCLMDNHYHMVIHVVCDGKEASRAFSNLFNAYTKAFNKRYNRTGLLFERPFKRKRITQESYLRNLIIYIHRNPQDHGLTNDFAGYKFSSYHHFVRNTNPNSFQIVRDLVISLFDDIKNLEYLHKDLSGFGNLTGLGNPSDPMPLKERFYRYIQNLQDTLCAGLEDADGKAKFREDPWERPEGGGGRTRIIENGAVFEKGGVNISAVHGPLPESMQAYFKVAESDFFACGLSLVLHPVNPMVPTVHANWRYFEMYDKQGTIVDQWFGGGQDLTPCYLFEEDARHFHTICKRACDAHNPDFYSKYKLACDGYFWNTHRDEARGVGGLFFDYCKRNKQMEMANWYDFVKGVGDSFPEAYLPIVEKRKNLPWGAQERDWQEIRRGRYVEFNLVHDKGTLFGLQTNGRIESILMSLPPKVQWKYDHHPEPGSREEALLKVLRHPRQWV